MDLGHLFRIPMVQWAGKSAITSAMRKKLLAGLSKLVWRVSTYSSLSASEIATYGARSRVVIKDSLSISWPFDTFSVRYLSFSLYANVQIASLFF